MWRITDASVIDRIRRELEEQQLLIADGHHRYEATLAYRDHMRRERGGSSGNESFNYIMGSCANIEDENVAILPTHRLVRGFFEVRPAVSFTVKGKSEPVNACEVIGLAETRTRESVPGPSPGSPSSASCCSAS